MWGNIVIVKQKSFFNEKFMKQLMKFTQYARETTWQKYDCIGNYLLYYNSRFLVLFRSFIVYYLEKPQSSPKPFNYINFLIDVSDQGPIHHPCHWVWMTFVVAYVYYISHC